MSQIKKIPPKDYAAFVQVMVNAYPGAKINTAEQMEEARKRLLRIDRENLCLTSYGLYQGKSLLGAMKLYDFSMTFGRTILEVGGVGSVAVDLAHKKEKVCKQLIDFYLDHYRKKGTALAALYPFRPDFYKKMGFGYGVKHNRYRIKPGDLPYSDKRKKVRFFRPADLRELVECYDRYAALTHGMMRRLKFEMERFKKADIKTVCYMSGKTIKGYIVFTFTDGKDDNFVSNDLKIIELIYENREALAGLLGFLHTQADQVRYITYNTQDEYFHHVPADPRSDTEVLFPPVAHESNIQGVGLMYRVLDIKKLFTLLKDHNFNGQTIRLKLAIRDSFMPENQGAQVVHFNDGRARLPRSQDDWEVEIELDMSDFSSLIMGVIDFFDLYRFGQAEISDKAQIETITRLFRTDRKPVCTTEF